MFRPHTVGYNQAGCLEHIKRSTHFAAWKWDLTFYKYVYSSSVSLIRSIVCCWNKAIFNPLDEAQTAIFKDPVRTALQTLFISVIKTSRFVCMGQKSLFVLR